MKALKEYYTVTYLWQLLITGMLILVLPVLFSIYVHFSSFNIMSLVLFSIVYTISYTAYINAKEKQRKKFSIEHSIIDFESINWPVLSKNYHFTHQELKKFHQEKEIYDKIKTYPKDRFLKEFAGLKFLQKLL